MADVQMSKNIDSNMVFVVGRIAKEPTVHESTTDKRYVRIRLAVTCRGADRPTAWLDLTDWNDQRWANIGQYLTKGRQIAVQGSLQTYKAQVQIDGKDIEIDRVGINVQEIQLLQRPASETQGVEPQPESPAAEAVAAAVEAGEVAF